MSESQLYAEQFERHRAHLQAVAYRMLGSVAEAEDAVQEAWLRLGRSDAGAVVNLRGWLTTVVGRICIDTLRARQGRNEEYAGTWLPEPVVSTDATQDPEREAELADSVGLALLVVLETLTPAERLAFVLHDMFGVSFDELAPIVGRSSTATRQLASRARRRVRGAPEPDADLETQREVVEAFLAASRAGNSTPCWPSSTRTSCSESTPAGTVLWRGRRSSVPMRSRARCSSVARRMPGLGGPRW